MQNPGFNGFSRSRKLFKQFPCRQCFHNRAKAPVLHRAMFAETLRRRASVIPIMLTFSPPAHSSRDIAS